MSTPSAIASIGSRPRLAGTAIAATLLLAVPLLATQADAQGNRGGGGMSMGGGGARMGGGGISMGGGGRIGGGGISMGGGAARIGGGSIGMGRIGGGGISMGRIGSGGGGYAVRSIGAPRLGGPGIGVRSIAGGGSNRLAVRPSAGPVRGSAARLAGPGAIGANRLATAGAAGAGIVGANRLVGGPGRPGTFTTAAAVGRAGNVNLGGTRAMLGNRVIANAALAGNWRGQGLHGQGLQGNWRGQGLHGQGLHGNWHGFKGWHGHAFHGRFHHGSHWPWWRGGIVVGWIGPVFWPYAYYDFFDYVFWPYAYDGFWPYAYDDVYYGLYGRYAYVDPAVRTGRPRAVHTVRADGSPKPVAGVCSENAPELTSWPIEQITQAVEPTEAQRAMLDELRSATAAAVDILKAACPNDLPSIPTGRLEAMKVRLQVMLQAVQTVRAPLDRLYQSLSDEQKARFNAVAPTDTASALGKDQRDLTRLCTERGPGIADLPIDRIAQAVRPTDAQRPALDELKAASARASEVLKGGCPTYRALTPTGRVAAMEQRLESMLEAVKTVQPALTLFYSGLSDEQKARFNTLGATARPGA